MDFHSMMEDQSLSGRFFASCPAWAPNRARNFVMDHYCPFGHTCKAKRDRSMFVKEAARLGHEDTLNFGDRNVV
jgi:hypothetical protein